MTNIQNIINGSPTTNKKTYRETERHLSDEGIDRQIGVISKTQENGIKKNIFQFCAFIVDGLSGNQTSSRAAQRCTVVNEAAKKHLNVGHKVTQQIIEHE